MSGKSSYLAVMPFNEKLLTTLPPIEVARRPDLDAYLTDYLTDGTTGERR